MAARQLAVLCVAVCFAMEIIPVVRAKTGCVLTNLTECDDDSPKSVVQSLTSNLSCPMEEKTKQNVPVFVIGETYQIKLKFRPQKDATFAKTVVKVKYGPFLIPVHVDTPDACSNKGLTCPLKADTDYTFTDVFTVHPVPKIYQKMRLTFLWSLVDEKPSPLPASSSVAPSSSLLESLSLLPSPLSSSPPSSPSSLSLTPSSPSSSSSSVSLLLSFLSSLFSSSSMTSSQTSDSDFKQNSVDDDSADKVIFCIQIPALLKPANTTTTTSTTTTTTTTTTTSITITPSPKPTVSTPAHKDPLILNVDYHRNNDDDDDGNSGVENDKRKLKPYSEKNPRFRFMEGRNSEEKIGNEDVDGDENDNAKFYSEIEKNPRIRFAEDRNDKNENDNEDDNDVDEKNSEKLRTLVFGVQKKPQVRFVENHGNDDDYADNGNDEDDTQSFSENRHSLIYEKLLGLAEDRHVDSYSDDDVEDNYHDDEYDDDSDDDDDDDNDDDDKSEDIYSASRFFQNLQIFLAGHEGGGNVDASDGGRHKEPQFKVVY